MQRLCSFLDSGEAHALAERLEKRGIAALVQDTRSIRPIMGERHFHVEVVLRFQYADAVALLKDENHTVSNPVDVNAFRRHRESAGKYPTISDKTVERFLNYFWIFVLVAIVLLVVTAFMRAR